MGERSGTLRSPDGEALGCDPGMLKRDLGHEEVSLLLGLLTLDPTQRDTKGLGRGAASAGTGLFQHEQQLADRCADAPGV